MAGAMDVGDAELIEGAQAEVLRQAFPRHMSAPKEGPIAALKDWAMDVEEAEKNITADPPSGPVRAWPPGAVRPTVESEMCGDEDETDVYARCFGVALSNYSLHAIGLALAAHEPATMSMRVFKSDGSQHPRTPVEVLKAIGSPPGSSRLAEGLVLDGRSSCYIVFYITSQAPQNISFSVLFNQATHLEKISADALRCLVPDPADTHKLNITVTGVSYKLKFVKKH